ncbi:MAG: hypothetical protein WBX11_07925 [Thiobacillaceae bacterium]|jgi:hypothetical protein
MNASRHLALIVGSTLAFQACAYENLVGEYTGRLSSVEGYSSNVGDPCAVMVGTSDRYGGSLTFEIRNVEKLMMETRKVEEALKRKSDTVKLLTPGGGQGKPIEIVVIKRGGDGIMQSLKLTRIWKQLHQEKSATCGDLLKK